MQQKCCTSLSLCIQVVHGPHGLSPAGSVRDFVLRHHSAFPGGVFWLNGRSEFLNGALELVNAVSPTICVLIVLWQTTKLSIISVSTDIIYRSAFKSIDITVLHVLICLATWSSVVLAFLCDSDPYL